MQSNRCGLGVLLLAAGFPALDARGDERPITWNDVPAAVRQAVAGAVAGAKWTEIVVEDEEEGATYRLKGTDPKGHRVEATVSDEGQVETVETALGPEDPMGLPAEIRKAADDAAPGAKWAEVVVQREDEGTTYRWKGTDPKGRPVRATIAVEVSVESVETTLDLKELPKSLAELMASKAGVKWQQAVVRAEESETVHEAVGTDPDGHELTATVADDGRATIRTELEMDEVPPAVAAALKAKHPDFRPDSVASIAEGKAVTYLLEGEDGDEEMRVSVSADGKTVELEDEADDEE